MKQNGWKYKRRLLVSRKSYYNNLNIATVSNSLSRRCEALLREVVSEKE